MAEVPFMTSRQVSEAVQELDGLAATLGMPNAERCSILGLSRGAYFSWHDGVVDSAPLPAPGLIRRLTYALPLLRRMVANTPMVPVGRGQNRLRPMAY